LKTDDDWEQAVEIGVICREPDFEENGYREFLKRKMERYRKMSAAGLGNWFGAFIDQQMVADLGLFHDGSLGRYQSVETHPDFRSQGIAGTLVYQAGCMAKAEYDLYTLVIVADQDSSAARLYQALGFQLTEKQVGMERWPGIEARTNENG
jgi:ribosomal protein S18 acetylase RimI-like enzyme